MRSFEINQVKIRQIPRKCLEFLASRKLRSFETNQVTTRQIPRKVLELSVSRKLRGFKIANLSPNLARKSSPFWLRKKCVLLKLQKLAKSREKNSPLLALRKMRSFVTNRVKTRLITRIFLRIFGLAKNA